MQASMGERSRRMVEPDQAVRRDPRDASPRALQPPRHRRAAEALAVVSEAQRAVVLGGAEPDGAYQAVVGWRILGQRAGGVPVRRAGPRVQSASHHVFGGDVARLARARRVDRARRSGSRLGVVRGGDAMRDELERIVRGYEHVWGHPPSEAVWSPTRWWSGHLSRLTGQFS